MSFSFYPRHEQNCPNVGHCPHLSGAALRTLVLLANETGKGGESIKGGRFLLYMRSGT